MLPDVRSVQTLPEHAFCVQKRRSKPTDFKFNILREKLGWTTLNAVTAALSVHRKMQRAAEQFHMDSTQSASKHDSTSGTMQLSDQVAPLVVQASGQHMPAQPVSPPIAAEGTACQASDDVGCSEADGDGHARATMAHFTHEDCAAIAQRAGAAAAAAAAQAIAASGPPPWAQQLQGQFKQMLTMVMEVWLLLATPHHLCGMLFTHCRHVIRKLGHAVYRPPTRALNVLSCLLLELHRSSMSPLQPLYPLQDAATRGLAMDQQLNSLSDRLKRLEQDVMGLREQVLIQTLRSPYQSRSL